MPPDLIPTLLYCRGVYNRIKQSGRSTEAVFQHPLFRGIGTTPPSVSDAAANHSCISGAGRCPKPDTKCCEICQCITSLRCGCTLASCRLPFVAGALLAGSHLFNHDNNDSNERRYCQHIGFPERNKKRLCRGKSHSQPERPYKITGRAMRHDRKRLHIVMCV